jgi:apolipoprotein N-acyltransferase
MTSVATSPAPARLLMTDDGTVPSPASGWREVLLVLAGGAATVAMFTLIFQPLNWWPLAFVCLVPWALASSAVHRAWLVHWGSLLAGFAFFLINLSWLRPVTGLGYAALCGYLAIYWPLAAWAVRTGRRFGLAGAWTLPAAWVGCELLRGWVMTGFPWLYLAHSMAGQLTFIQISDLAGAYGVSLLIALVNGVLCEFLLDWRVRAGTAQSGPRRPRKGVHGAAGRAESVTLLSRWTGAPVRRFPGQKWAAASCTLVLVGATLLYGRMRLSQAGELSEGPLVAVIQHDFVQLSVPPYTEAREVVFSEYLALGAQAALHNPDLIVFPETAWGSHQNIDFLKTPLQAVDEVDARAYAFGHRTHLATAAFARGEYARVNETIAGWERLFRQISAERPELALRQDFPRLPVGGGPPATVVIGSLSIEKLETTYPRQKKFNSALVYDADGTQRPQRYDKNHLVPFGEFVPFCQQRFLFIDLHPLYRWLNKLSPFSEGGQIEYSLWPGREQTVFTLEAGGRTYRFGTPICYEDVMPYLIRRYVWQGGQRRVDFLVNISNDGWFLHSAELPQHLAICVFRAVENRVGIARAVNTGISGFIDPSGRTYNLVEKEGRLFGSGVAGYQAARMLLDPRGSFYGRSGDWLAGLCLAGSGALWASAMFTRWVLGIVNWFNRMRARWRRGGFGR